MARPLLAGQTHWQPASPQTLLDLARVLEARDPATKGHSQRVAAHAARLARWLGWPEPQVRQLELAGLLHDLGKVVVPLPLLTKPGPLTEAEWAVMRQHPVRGEELCRAFPVLAPILPAVRAHHERWDGQGYPDGLAGRTIPLWARLLAVVDGYDALTSDRAYRAGLTPAAALAVVQAGAGTQWDPALVASFAAMLSRQPTPAPPALWTGLLTTASDILRRPPDATAPLTGPSQP